MSGPILVWRIFTVHLRHHLARPSIRVFGAAGVSLSVIVLLSQRLANGDPLAPVYVLVLGWNRAAVALFYILPPLAGALMAGRTESGQGSQRAIDGESPSSQTAVDLLLALTAFWSGCLVALSAVTLVETVESIWTGPGTGDTAPWPQVLSSSGQSALLCTVVAIALGYICGVTASTRLTAVLASLGAALGTQLAQMMAEASFPGLGWAYVLTPQGAAFTLTDLESPMVGGGGPAAAVAAASLIVFGTASLMIGRTVAQNRVNPPVRETRDSESSPSARSGHVRPHFAAMSPRIITRVAGHFLVLMAFGALVPVALRSEVPWSLRPAWLADKANHRTSQDIVNQLFADVRAGDLASANALTRRGDATVMLGPYLPGIRSGTAPTTQVYERRWAGPGRIAVTLSNGARFSICAQREAVGWIVTDLRSDGQCPSALGM